MKANSVVFFLVIALGFNNIASAQFCPQNFDGVMAPALPSGWTSTQTGAGVPWVATTTSPDTAPNSAFAADVSGISDILLVSPGTIVTASNASFYFRHSYNMESTFDGGVLEISVDSGAFTDIVTVGGSFSTGAYNSTISTGFSSPIAGRMAWSGNSGGFITTGVSLPAATVGHTVAIRWRAASDTSVGAAGWNVDTILCGTVPAPPPTPWSLAAPYPVPILDQAVATLGNKLYSFGGVSAGAISASAYRFDGSVWTPIAALPVALEYPAVASNGQYLYIIGGANIAGTAVATVYRYDPAANTYSSMAPAPTAAWNNAAVYLDGKIYKIGGSVTTPSIASTNAVEVYNIAGNNWVTVSNYPIAASFISVFVRNGFIYAAGGSDATSSTSTAKTYRYDPSTNLWDDIAMADLPQTRWGAAAASFHNGGMLAGGYISGQTTITDSAIQWLPATNTWSNLPTMLTARARFGGAVLRGCFHAIGGRSASGAGTGFSGTTENQKFDCIFYDGFDQ